MSFKHLPFLIPVYLLLILIGLAGCNSKPTELAITVNTKLQLDSLLENYYQEHLKFFPLQATSEGDNRYNDTLPNYLSNDFKIAYQEFLKKTQEGLATLPLDSLYTEDLLSVDVLKWECEIGLEGLQYDDHLLPINQFSSLNLWIGQLASGSSAQPFKTVEDYENWLLRVDDFQTWAENALTNMQEGAEVNIVLPKSLIKKTIPQLASFKSGPTEDHLFYTPIKNIPETFSEVEKHRLDSLYREMIEKKIMPTFEKIYQYASTDYLTAGRETTGINELPNGAAWYNYLIKYYTTTNMTADEVFELGKNEVARIESEMKKVKEEVGFEGDLKAFFDHVRTLPELMPYTDPQQVIDHFVSLHEKIKPNLAKLFDKTPKTPFEVRRTEAFRENSASAEYNVGSTDGSRPGIFYVPIPDVKSYNSLSDEDLFLHEAIPGHHYQISLQQENNNLPSFRKTLWYSAYGEGWALYTESLGKELGLYTDPYQYFGMLSAEMHRAIRLVVDAGMHSQGWTREQAIQYSLDHEAETEEGIIAEIERYMAIPGQALSYKIGQLKIRELRNLAQEKLGDKFDIRQYHNIVLESGCIPLALLEKRVNTWIDQVLETR